MPYCSPDYSDGQDRSGICFDWQTSSQITATSYNSLRLVYLLHVLATVGHSASLSRPRAPHRRDRGRKPWLLDAWLVASEVRGQQSIACNRGCKRYLGFCASHVLVVDLAVAQRALPASVTRYLRPQRASHAAVPPCPFSALLPRSFSGPLPEYCGKEVFDPAQLGPFQGGLAFYLRNPTTTIFPENLHTFWSHEWSRCGQRGSGGRGAGVQRRAGDVGG